MAAAVADHGCEVHLQGWGVRVEALAPSRLQNGLTQVDLYWILSLA